MHASAPPANPWNQLRKSGTRVHVKFQRPTTEYCTPSFAHQTTQPANTESRSTGIVIPILIESLVKHPRRIVPSRKCRPTSSHRPRRPHPAAPRLRGTPSSVSSERWINGRRKRRMRRTLNVSAPSARTTFLPGKPSSTATASAMATTVPSPFPPPLPPKPHQDLRG